MILAEVCGIFFVWVKQRSAKKNKKIGQPFFVTFYLFYIVFFFLVRFFYLLKGLPHQNFTIYFFSRLGQPKTFSCFHFECVWNDEQKNIVKVVSFYCTITFFLPFCNLDIYRQNKMIKKSTLKTKSISYILWTSINRDRQKRKLAKRVKNAPSLYFQISKTEKRKIVQIKIIRHFIVLRRWVNKN